MARGRGNAAKGGRGPGPGSVRRGGAEDSVPGLRRPLLQVCRRRRIYTAETAVPRGPERRPEQRTLIPMSCNRSWRVNSVSRCVANTTNGRRRRAAPACRSALAEHFLRQLLLGKGGDQNPVTRKGTDAKSRPRRRFFLNGSHQGGDARSRDGVRRGGRLFGSGRTGRRLAGRPGAPRGAWRGSALRIGR